VYRHLNPLPRGQITSGGSNPPASRLNSTVAWTVIFTHEQKTVAWTQLCTLLKNIENILDCNGVTLVDSLRRIEDYHLQIKDVRYAQRMPTNF